MIRDNFWRIVITYITSFCMVAGGLHWAFFFTILGSVTAFDVYAVDEIKQRLETTHQLDEAKNVDGTDLYNKILDRNDQLSSNPHLEQELLNKDYGVGRTLDFGQYPDVDFAEEYKAYLDDGLGVKEQGKAPAMTDGNIDVQYYEKSSVKLERDEDGNIVTTLIPVDERGELKTSIDAKEAFSSQVDRDDAEFNAPSNYGDEDAYLDDMKKQYLNASDAKTMESEAYRSIIKANNDNPAPRVKSDAYFLKPGNDSLTDARDGQGIWAQTCRDETITETEKVQVPVWEPKVCQKPNHQNLGFCEITRVLEESPDNPNEYIEKYTQNPAGCADKLGWEPSCPLDNLIANNNAFINPIDVYVSNEQPFFGNKLRGSPMVMSAFDLSMSAAMAASSGTINGLDYYIRVGNYFSGERVDPDQLLKFTHVRGDVTFSNGMLETIMNIEHVIDNQYLVSYKYDTPIGVCDTQNIDFLSSSYPNPRRPKYINSANDPYLLEQCFVNIDGGTKDFSCTYKSAACSANPKPPYECPVYVPEAEVDDFCTFDEWEVIDQGTYNYSQNIIKNMPKMFAGDPNPEAVYGGDENGEGGYHVATWKINAKGYSCDPLKSGEYCVMLLNKETEEFEEHCYNYEEFKQLEGSCAVYENNEKCEQTDRSCAEGWFNSQTNTCYMYTDEYRCDVSTPYEKTTTKTKNVCAGMLPCVGDDCDYGGEESSDDFENAVLMASISQTVADDSNCVNTDPNTCEIFPGEPKYCSWEVSGLGNNCCDAPSGINYIELAMMGYKMMQTETFKSVSSTLSGGFTDKVGGMYSDFSAMLVDGWNTGSKVVVDFASSVMGDPEFMSGVAETVSTGGASVTEAINGVMHTIQQQIYSTLNNLLPEALADMLFQEVTAESAERLGAQIGDTVLSDGMSQMLSVISFIGWVYTIYNVVKILANLLTQCDEEEQDMGVKIAQKQCFKVGKSYCAEDILGICYLKRQDWCCYSSMLARIIGDQGSKQLGKDMNSCPGFTIDEFSRVDFDRLDLSEWLATMYEADIISTTGYDIERLTGTGRTMGNNTCDSGDADCEEMTRINAEDRAVDMFSGDMSDTANQLKDNFDPEQIDCSIYPRPLICEMN
ncbi:conjugal transfer protein TraN [Shewanella aestuarii]|uniref:Conjugal transfer protein TraN n=1 Tax=Shewanella aestuarii TaxID=1028752 RepID=A0A6G9QP31_9GAMM|nr:conjugal transfer protein TraN [Shewanella aestuarii]QIR16326.1 conjugal transfer protein TraN [Shewanella aestuarii]